MRLASLGVVLCALGLFSPGSGAAQSEAPIADNSFLIEEAYNQEAGVVQHIGAFSRASGGAAWELELTQEWPLGGMRHQLSYMLPLLDPGEVGAGLGDVQVNYRYQLVGDGESALHVAPRLSVLLPTGSESEGRGTGSLGFDLGLPVSYVVSDAFVTHWNASVVTDTDFEDSDVFLGASVIWRARRSVNLMLESVWDVGENDVLFLNPGIRWAHDFASGLQIVPGVAYTFAVSGDAEDALFLYLSFEHSFGSR